MDFKNIEVYTDLKKQNKTIVDLQESIADLIYQKGYGIQAHALALKIYNSDADTQFTDSELQLLQEFVNKFCPPMIIDAITNYICKH